MPFRAPLIPRTIRRLSAPPESSEGINVAPVHSSWSTSEHKMRTARYQTSWRASLQGLEYSCRLRRIFSNSSFRCRTRPTKPPTVILLHPAQPRSHVGRLILGPLSEDPLPTRISFQASRPCLSGPTSEPFFFRYAFSKKLLYI
ncbi:hypothetical protein ARMSODRAFT_961204 [Armillaria solidipes]|uniref:Uncharacterized protein n=1 Tax=Armillaria solidipes TaxID=1076256 RepID=A0A2H3B3T1_9AGAR|nr:hypothetical protein ARMSODRAFT_961204 [Armillaria solidipes]